MACSARVFRAFVGDGLGDAFRAVWVDGCHCASTRFMGRDVPSRERTLIEQAFRLRQDFPGGKAKLRPTLLVWTGRLTPTPLSREYTVRILYARGHYPRVMLVEPRLESEERQLLHHLYPNGDLCLHRPDEWNPSMLLVETIVPWTTEWLAHYELWKRTRQWYGDGDGAEGATPTAAPAPLGEALAGRTQRRREARDAARRARREGGGAGGDFASAVSDSGSRTGA
jgi:hypothetical protein